MYFYGCFLINFFILPMRAEAINYMAKFRPGKVGSPLYKGGIPSCWDETFYMQSQDVIYEEFITLPGFWQSGTEFHPG